MLNILEEKKDNEIEIHHTLQHLKEAFETCTTARARRGVLMLVPKEVRKAEVCELFGCSLYEIKTARAVSQQFGACGEEPKKEEDTLD